MTGVLPTLGVLKSSKDVEKELISAADEVAVNLVCRFIKYFTAAFLNPLKILCILASSWEKDRESWNT